MVPTFGGAAGGLQWVPPHGHRYNLNKEFQALAVDATEATTAAASRPPVAVAIPEPALGDGVPLAPVPTPVLATTSVVEQQHPQNNPPQGRRQRASRTASQQEPGRAGSDRLRHAQRREEETPAEREERQRFDRIRQEERRANLEQEQTEQASRREYHLMQREAWDDVDNEEAPQNERTRRGTTRRGHALANYEVFRVYMISGPNTVDGRHKLPQQCVLAATCGNGLRSPIKPVV
ncbi:unnamed protein product [Phytophthora fragariaefolia]|uniref:Unnamed protein product n=1 Tax=Phytophthora fragariaefolia TaxID=1490495 RepID=A0A9W7D2J7_9STRA|nr:unnamed protein product [Phytophthora fragariaefolia]